MKLNIEKGSDVSFNNEGFKIVEILSLCQVLAERVSDGRRMRLPIHGLEEYSESNENNVPAPYELISEKNWKEAERRFSIIEPILPLSNRSAKIESLAEEQKIHKATIYRWIQRFEDSGNLSSLAPVKRTGGQGKSRLTFNV